LEISYLMKRRFLSLMLIAVLTFTLVLPNAYSDFSPNQKYLVQASGYLIGKQNIYDSTVAVQLSTGATSGSNMFGTLENALVTIGDNNYLNTGVWQASFLRDGKYFVLQGDAQNQNGDVIHVNIFGRIIDSNQDGSLFSITGKITGTETLKVIYSAKVSSLSAITTQPTTTPTQTPTQPTQTSTVSIHIVSGAHNIDNQQFFSPSYLKISPGTTVVWTNDDTVSHRIMSGIASATISSTSGTTTAPRFTPDGKIDSGIIPPGKSFQYTVTGFDTRSLSSSLAKYLNLDPNQEVGDITFFDQNYTWMVGVLAPAVPVQQTTNTQITIFNGASNINNFPYLSSASIQIVAGSTVTWLNNDVVSHRILSGQIQTGTQGSAGATVKSAPLFTPDGKIDSGVIAPGQTYTVTISGVGSTQFYDPNYSWINGLVISSSQPIKIQPAVKISIQPGSSTKQGSATQQQFNRYNNYYAPSDIQIVPGTPIIWTNDDTVAHKIYSGVSTQRNDNPFTPDGKIVSGNIAPGTSFQVIINETGIIRFYDPNYTWMNGMIVSIPSSSSRVIAAPSMNPGLH